MGYLSFYDESVVSKIISMSALNNKTLLFCIKNINLQITRFSVFAIMTLVNKNFVEAIEVSCTSLILCRLFRIRKSFLILWGQFCSAPSIAVFWSKITFPKLFCNFEKFLNFFFIWKGNKIRSSLQKKSSKSDNGFGDIALRCKKILKILRLKKIFFY